MFPVGVILKVCGRLLSSFTRSQWLGNLGLDLGQSADPNIRDGDFQGYSSRTSAANINNDLKT
jgi:hypothetical protein